MQTIKRRIDYGRTARAPSSRFTGVAPADLDGLPEDIDAPAWEITPARPRRHGGVRQDPRRPP